MQAELLDQGPDVAALRDVEQLEARLQGRLGGQVRNLQLVLSGDGLVLRGYCRTYHAKQLAQHGVMGATRRRLIANEIRVV